MPRLGYVAAVRLVRRRLHRACPERVWVELLDHGPLPVIDPVSNRIGEMVDEIAWDRPSRPDVRVRDVEAGGVERRTLCPVSGGLEVAQQPAAVTTTR